MISSSIVANEVDIPEIVYADSAENYVSVVDLVVMGHPLSNESPEGLGSVIST